VDKQLNFQAV